MPTISIITVAFNCALKIEATLASVLEQDFPHIEYIIIDGGSEDGSQALIEARRSRLAHYVSEPDCGIYDAMNKGVHAAKGDLLLFLNCGDTLHSPQVLSQFVAQYYQPGFAGIYLCSVLTDRGELIEPRRIELRRRYKLPVYHQGILYPLAALRERPFDLRFPLAADFHQYYQLTNTLPVLPVPLTLARFDTAGVSSTRTDDLNREFIDVYRDLGIGWPSRLYRRLRLLLRR